MKTDQGNLRGKVAMCGIAALLLAVAIRACSFVLEPDYFWHVKLGEWIATNRSMMGPDIFSWVAEEYPMMEFAHSWLSSVLIYLFHAFGAIPAYPYWGAFLYEITTFSICIGALLFALRKDIPYMGRDIMTSVVLAIIPVLAMVSLTPRPQMIGNILFVWMLGIFRAWDKGRNPKAVYWLPVVSVLWANFHGGTAPILLVFCVLYLVAGSIPLSAGQIQNIKKPLDRLKHLAVASLLSVGAMLLNPYGYKILVYSFLFNNAACKEGVQEWQPTTIYSSLAIYLMIIAVLIIVLSPRGRFSLTSLIPLALTGGLTLLYVRGSAYFGIAMAFFLVDGMYCGLSEEKQCKKGSLFAGSFLLTAVFLVIAVISFPVSAKQFEESNFILSDEMVSHIGMGNYARLYNDYNTGGYLIYKGIPVFIDSRADLYPEDVLRDGKNLQYWRCDADAVIQKYDFDALLVSKEDFIFRYLKLSGKYDSVFEDTRHALFVPVETLGIKE